MEFSLRYTPVTGRLHTRYAPVRRSSPEYCYPALPLDLHVLSLPLAFILSQDQTLHCKNCSFYLFDSSSCPSTYLIYVNQHTLSLSSHTFQTTFAFLLVINIFFNMPFFVESGCKDTTIFQTTKIFFQKNYLNRCKVLIINSSIKEKKIIRPPKNSPKVSRNGSDSVKFRSICHQKSKKEAKIKLYVDYQ